MEKEDVFKKMSRIHFSLQLISSITFAHEIKDKENFELLLETLYKIHGNKYFKEGLEVEDLEENQQTFFKLVTAEIDKLFDEFTVLCDEIKAKDFKDYAPMFFTIMFNIIALEEAKQRIIIKKAARVLYEARNCYSEENLENLMDFMNEEMQDLLMYELEQRVPYEQRFYLMRGQQMGEA